MSNDPMVTKSVSKATAYGDASSLGRAANKLLRQYKFPLDYEVDEPILFADHDRLLGWDRDHALQAFKRHMNTGELGLPSWLDRTTDRKVLNLLRDLFKVEENHPDVKWTGYRVTVTVNRSNGYPVFSLWLFAKKRGSETKVYTGMPAPNVIGPSDRIAKGSMFLGGMDCVEG